MHVPAKIAKTCYLLIIILSLTPSVNLFAQTQEVKLKVYQYNINKDIVEAVFRSFPDSISAIQYLNSFRTDYLSKGYLAAGYDSIVFRKNDISAYFLKGLKYSWENIQVRAEDTITAKIYNLRRYKDDKITEKEFGYLLNDVVSAYENIGYPFCVVWLDSISFRNNLVSAVICTDPGDFIVLDSLILKGNSRVKLPYLKKYLGFKDGSIYKEKYIESMNTSLNNLAFINQSKKPEIAFGKNTADVILYLSDNKTSSFSGIIGFLPEEQTSGKLLVTGDADLFLQNLLGRGEHLALNWTRYQALSQTLKADFSFPYFLNSNIGIAAGFDMFKQDTSYLNLTSRVGLRYMAQANNGVLVFYENISSFPIGNTEESGSMANYSGFTSHMLGLGYSVTRYDYFYNPSKGYSLSGEASSGIKKTDSDTSIKSNPVVMLGINAKLYIPITQRIVWKQSIASKALFCSNIYRNELFQLGGIKSFRGVAENTLEASSFAIVTSEIRYLFERNSAVFAFCDYGCIYNEVTTVDRLGFPVGFGVGIDLQTKAGIFSLAYAYGIFGQGSFDLRAAKIHFGYIARF
ncbi:MAG TPA: hypothetical protein PLK75_07555 [Bacteroidales bacterium]|nr:hypothetical protein [Bacteroidales bacterium]